MTTANMGQDPGGLMDWLKNLMGNDGAQTFGAGPDTAQGLTFSGANGNLPGGDLGASTGIGMNIGTGQMAIKGLATLGNLYGSLQSSKLAKEQFKFSKDFANKNLANQTQTYNTALSDRLTSRGVALGQSSAEVQTAIDKNRLAR
jgi:hypothetical protein